jgi:hypothetical protein
MYEELILLTSQFEGFYLQNKCREDKVYDYVSSSEFRTEPGHKDS